MVCQVSDSSHLSLLLSFPIFTEYSLTSHEVNVFSNGKKKLKQETHYKTYTHLSSKTHSYTYKHTFAITHASTR